MAILYTNKKPTVCDSQLAAQYQNYWYWVEIC